MVCNHACARGNGHADIYSARPITESGLRELAGRSIDGNSLPNAEPDPIMMKHSDAGNQSTCNPYPDWTGEAPAGRDKRAEILATTGRKDGLGE